MSMPRKVVITCAVTGSIHTPSMSPYLPVTPREIAEAAVGAAQAGLEESLWIGPGKLAEDNAAQVRKAPAIVEGMGFEIATPDDARALLALKGRDRMAF